MTERQPAKALAGRVILVVEDEMLLAMDLQTFLENQGCTVLGPIQSVTRALTLLAEHEDELDAATLDMNLNGEISAPVASALREKSVPFVVVSGYSDRHVDLAFRDVPFVRKPFNENDLLAKLSYVLTR